MQQETVSEAVYKMSQSGTPWSPMDVDTLERIPISELQDILHDFLPGSSPGSLPSIAQWSESGAHAPTAVAAIAPPLCVAQGQLWISERDRDCTWWVKGIRGAWATMMPGDEQSSLMEFDVKIAEMLRLGSAWSMATCEMTTCKACRGAHRKHTCGKRGRERSGPQGA